MRLGSSTYWWHEEALTAQHIAQMAQAGVAVLEISDYHPNFNYLRVKWLAEIRQVVQDHGLAMSTVHTHLRWHDPALHLAHPDPVRYRRAIEAYLRAVDALVVLGCPILLTHDLDLAGQEGTEDPAARVRTIDALREIADYCQAAGMRIVVENMPRGWAANVSRVCSVVKAVNHPALGICLDTAHAYRGDNVEQAFPLVAPYLHALHINDADTHAEHLMPGEGAIPWSAVMQRLKHVAYTGDFVYELGDATKLSALRTNFSWLQQQVASG
jgi:sugar phosphate isomerase/epimerase